MGNYNNDKNKIRRKKISSSSTKTTASSSKSTKTSSSKNSTRKPNKKDKFKIIRTIGVALLVTLVLGVAASSALIFVALKNVEPITKALLDKKVNTVTELLYNDGSLMGNPPTDNKKVPISIKDMPAHLQHALVSIEDERFYEHDGVDFKGLARAAVLNLLTSSSPGGSTIPMQVSKNLLTSKEVSVIRKIKDIYYALEMNKTLSKEEILELYLNSAYFGSGAIGVEAAANAYFDKHAKDLSTAESAMIVGITQNPQKYAAYRTAKLTGNETKDDLKNKVKFFVNGKNDNFDDPTRVERDMVDKMYSWGLIPDYDYYKQLKNGTMVCRKVELNPDAKKRQETVLAKMLELGYLTQEEYNKSIAEKIEIKLPKPTKKPASTVEDLIEDDVISSLINQGYTDTEAHNLYFNGGLKIRTTIDKSMQGELEGQFNNRANFPETIMGSDGVPQPQAAMVILDYRTGQIKALMGGREIKARKVWNRAISPHQPGSTIKPLAVYTPAIDNGKNQADTFSDVPGGYRFSQNNEWDPKTTTAGTGSMTMRQALAKSSNTIAVKVAETLGDSYEDCVDTMLDYLKNFGLSDLKDGPGGKDRKFSALTLGGMTKGVSPLDMAAAYGTLANGGVYVEPITFTTIESSDGQVLVQNTPEEHKVVDAQVAYVVTDMMKSVITEGTGKSASIGSMPVAGKTGTTNEDKDAWFVGYTPYYVGSTYIGDDYRLNPDTKSTIPRRGVAGGSSTSAKLWAHVMSKVHKDLKPTEFKKPSSIEFFNINLFTGNVVGKGSYNSAIAAFIKGHTPSGSAIDHTPQVPKATTEEKKPENENPDNANTQNPQNPSTPENQTPNTGANGTNNGANGNQGNNNQTTTPGGTNSPNPGDGNANAGGGTPPTQGGGTNPGGGATLTPTPTQPVTPSPNPQTPAPNTGA
ncbi:transglycosylase domain-containing protein [Paeniclostridium sordellii]|uniref:transglycosylase domain-containing protein n=1 Tax=Paraclostridium sordellii TaxID=1505 RepID=UPI002149C4C6|nr:transglycosylase domain-containing protein [Paeniclostridium sordellii]MCR1850518.1 transglycosylase domain-containing protein [Paeniclostridium sordellii]